VKHTGIVCGVRALEGPTVKQKLCTRFCETSQGWHTNKIVCAPHARGCLASLTRAGVRPLRAPHMREEVWWKSLEHTRPS